MAITIPQPFSQPFVNGIRHPDLYLWDAWSFVDSGNTIHLYSLAVSRTKPDGAPLLPADRNGFPFHIRHFTSDDDGLTWTDQGSLMTRRDDPVMPDALTIWSGSIEPLPDGKVLLAYTGLYDAGAAHCFCQNLMLALTDGSRIISRASEPILCPRRDWDMIIRAGYYLAQRENLGHKDGEDGGPIMGWRDPFIFIDPDGLINLFWSAKVSPKEGAMGHATLRRDGDDFQLVQLHPPISLPDGPKFTQFELPKIYWNSAIKSYILIASTCSRQHENQPDAEVQKVMRAYRSASLRGPWQIFAGKDSALEGLDLLFGMTVLKTEHQGGQLLCIAPFTDCVDPEIRLTFAPRFHLDLDSLESTFG